MSEKETLTIDERFKVLRIKQAEYREADRTGKSEILEDLVRLTGLNRKTVIRRLNGSCRRKARRKQRHRSYGPEVDDALRVISEAYNHICAERLQPNLVSMAEHLAYHHELQLSPELRAQLGRISVSTVRRILQRVRQDMPRRPRTTGLGANARSQIPTLRIPWDTHTPGRFEVDLVHFCGPSASGEYVHVLVMVDVATGWCEPAAMLGRSYLVMQDAFSRCLQRVPFPVLEIHPDNGSEFFSDHLLRYWREKAHCPCLTRSRPYHKDDNRFVEHRNGALIRAWLGHDRLDTVQQTRLLNQRLEQLWLYFNFFQPVMRLADKSWDGSKVHRRHDQAATPFDRLVASGTLSPARLKELTALRRRTNPRQLRHELLLALNTLFRLPPAQEGQTEDVYLTLLIHPSERRWASR